MIRPVREDIDKIYIVAKGGYTMSKFEEIVRWMPRDIFPGIGVIDRIPNDLGNKARYLLIIHYSAVDRRITSNISDYIKIYVDQGFLVSYVAERGISNMGIPANMISKKNMQIEMGIEEYVFKNMVDICYEEDIHDYNLFYKYIDNILPKREIVLSSFL